MHVPIVQAALDKSLDQHPAHLVVDLTRMPFCSVRGLALLTQTGRTAAENATGYVISGVLPQIDQVWILCWGDDRPVRYRSTAAVVDAIRAADSDLQFDRDKPLTPRHDRKAFGSSPRCSPADVPGLPSRSWPA